MLATELRYRLGVLNATSSPTAKVFTEIGPAIKLVGERQEPWRPPVPGPGFQLCFGKGCFSSRIAKHLQGCLVPEIGRHGVAAARITKCMPDPGKLADMRHEREGETGLTGPGMGYFRRLQLRKNLAHKRLQYCRGFWLRDIGHGSSSTNNEPA